jgi:hypothetical protein
VRTNIPALLLSALIVAGLVVSAVRGFSPAPIAGAATGAGEAGLRQAASAPGCPGTRPDADGRYSFGDPCGGQAPSPDGAYLVVKNAGEQAGVGVVRAGSGKVVGDLGELADGMGFQILWSPRRYWFVADHYLGSGMSEAHLFEIVGGELKPRPRLTDEARRILRARYPCIPAAQAVVWSLRWSRDGGRIALQAGTRPDACGTNGNWSWLWMIGDPATGRVDPRSVREIPDPPSGKMPSDGPYAGF